MSRPVSLVIASGQAAWDVDINDNTAVIFDKPFPPHEVADETALNLLDPTTYDRCIAATVTPPSLWISDGVGWVRLVKGSYPAIADPAFAAVAGTGDDVGINLALNNLDFVLTTLLNRCRQGGLIDP